MSKAKILGMVHVQALPGTPKHENSLSKIYQKALAEAQVYYDNGLAGIIIENMHDIPYQNRSVGPEITATMTVVARALRNKFPEWTIGVQVLAGANKEALAIAHSCGLDFIRAEGFVYGHLADEGYIDADAGELLRYRKMIGADQVKVYCDIKKKHAAHALTNDLGIDEIAKAAKFFLADGLIITGSATGEEASVDELNILNQSNLELPILIGSGISAENVSLYVSKADFLIVGSSFKKDSFWSNDIDEERVKRFMDIVRGL